MIEEMKMSVSPIVRKDGKKYIYVEFDDGTHRAEGRLPDKKLVSNEGFSEEEVAALEFYLKHQEQEIVEMAKKVNAMNAFMKPDGKAPPRKG